MVEPRASAREGHLTAECDPYPLPQEREGNEVFSPGCGNCPALDFHPGVPDIRHHDGVTGLAPLVCR